MIVYVQLDSAQTAVIAVFGCAQDPIDYPNQATIDSSDSRYLAFINPASTPAGIHAVLSNAIQVKLQCAALLDSRTTLDRIMGAVAQGKTTLSTPDVVAWFAWRDALRAIVTGADTTSTAIPARPAYPAGT